MISISIVGDKALIEKLSEKSAALMPALLSTMQIQADKLVKYIQENKLSGQVLKQRSGRLKQSIKNLVAQNGAMVTATVATNVEYAKIHEYGGKTQPHVIYPKNGQALHFIWKGKEVFFKKVNHPGSKFPERSFMRSSLNENTALITEALTQTIYKVMNA